MNAVEREPVETRVLNPTASEACYKPKQRSYRTTNLKKKFWRRNVRRRIVQRRKGGAESAAPKRTRPQKIVIEKKKTYKIFHHMFNRNLIKKTYFYKSK